MKNAEIRELSDKELAVRIKEEKVALTKLNFTHAVSPLDNPNRLKENKKTIARLLTEQKKRQLANAQ
ncbi:MAG: 50S ribosomal protein L29 [Bacteroidota bacterium]|jgi:large subunit ribosomal protein L29|nr:50S ribosomal protein L29 [Sphingobacteriales bacterium]